MHCINVILLKLKDVPKDLEVHKLKEDIVATCTSNKKKLCNLKIEHIVISTDYFGGAGEQSCIYRSSNKYIDFNSINKGLKMLGVVPTQLGYDEFDTVGLGNYRSNDKFKFSLLQDVPETLPSMTAWFKHLEKINK